jgi:hypothetical protein
MHPGVYRLRRVKRMPPVVDSQEGLLHEIFHLILPL